MTAFRVGANCEFRICNFHGGKSRICNTNDQRPLLAIALIVGLLVSIFQATTQIQEQTLAFIPKIVAVMLGLIFFGVDAVDDSFVHN